MKNNDNKITNTNNESKKEKATRIVKRRWWVIALIITVVLSMLIGIGVGLYFVFKPKSWDVNTNNLILLDGDNEKDMKRIRDDIHNGGNSVGIFYYQEDESVANWLLWDDTKGKGGDDASKGPLVTYLDQQEQIATNITWYGVKIDGPTSTKAPANLFLDKDKDALYEDFWNLDAPHIEQTKSYSWDFKPDDVPHGGYNPSNDKVDHTSFSLDVDDSDKKNPKLNQDNSEYSVNSGTTMFFTAAKDSYSMLQTVISSWTAPDTSTDNTNKGRIDSQALLWLNNLTDKAIHGNK